MMRRKKILRLVATAALLVAAGALLALAAGDDRIIYEEDTPMGWRWRREASFPDQYLALVMDEADLQALQLALPNHVWEANREQLTAWLADPNTAVVVAYLGEAPTGGYGIHIRQVRVDILLPHPVVTVVVDRRHPAPGEFVTMAITHPLALVPVQRDRLPQPPFSVRFVDSQGRRLAEQSVLAVTTPTAAPAPVNMELAGELRVAGYGEVRIAPDQATVAFNVIGRAETAPEAQELMNEQLAAVLRNLRQFGLPDEAIHTQQFSLSPRYRYDQERGQQVLIGYEARTQMEVHLGELDRLGALVQTLVDAGVTEVTRINYSLQNVRAAQERALREAALDARWRAETIAKALGQRIVGVIEVHDQSRGSAPPVALPARAASLDAAAAPEFLPDELSIRAEVVVLFRVAPQ